MKLIIRPFFRMIEIGVHASYNPVTKKSTPSIPIFDVDKIGYKEYKKL
jgi:hypothetical protein